jgi:hypothetical protein
MEVTRSEGRKIYGGDLMTNTELYIVLSTDSEANL